VADYSDLDPTALRASLSDGTRLKKSITTDLYTGGTPSAANQVKRSIMYADGTLKESVTYADGTLKPSWLIAGGGGAAPSTDFITTWNGTATQTLTMPTTGTGYDGTVTWEDSSGVIATGAFTDVDMSALTVTTPSTETVTCTITGDLPRVYFHNGGDKAKITAVTQWGDQQWTSMYAAFSGCTNITFPATDTPDLSVCSSLDYAFFSIPTFNEASIASWDVSNVSGFLRMCQGSTAFNVDISGWDMSNAASCYSMLQQTAFNQDISGWSFGSNCNLEYMLYGTPFNQDIGGMDISNVGAMTGMCQGVTTWSTANYNATLIGWAAQTVNSGLSFHGGSSVATGAGLTARTSLINDDSWTITDGTP